MDTQNQFAVFGLCILIGFIGGILYEPFAFFRLVFGCKNEKNKIIGGILDCAFWVLFAIVSVCLSCAFKFPSFRLYIGIGYLFGGIIYLKSLHRIVAFFENVCYNKIIQGLTKRKNRKKLLRKETGKR